MTLAPAIAATLLRTLGWITGALGLLLAVLSLQRWFGWAAQPFAASDAIGAGICQLLSALLFAFAHRFAAQARG